MAANIISVRTRQWLIEQGFDPDDINHIGKHRDTPLILACRKGEVTIATDLINSGSAVNHRNIDGTDALWACAVADAFDLASQLLQAGANINNQNDNGATVLMYAASAGKNAWVKFLLEQGAETQLTNLDDFSALDLAGNIECLRLLRPLAGWPG